MGIRGALMSAAGLFVVTTVTFAAAVAIAHSLVIPDPVGRLLPISRSEVPDTSVDERATEGVALADDPAVGAPPKFDDVSVPEVTAEPTPRDPAGGESVPIADAAGPDTVAIDQPGDAAPDDVRRGDLRSDAASSQDEGDGADPDERGAAKNANPPPPTQSAPGDAASAAVEERLEWPRAPQPTESASPSPAESASPSPAESETPTPPTPSEDVDSLYGGQRSGPYGDRLPRPPGTTLHWRDDYRSGWDVLWPPDDDRQY